MAIINEELKNIKGYYCGYCNKFHRPDEIKKTYTVEVIGKNITIKDKSISCPEGCKPYDFEEFNPEWWTHLAAMLNKKYKGAVWIKCPVYKNPSDISPVGYKTVRTTEEVEALAGRLCVEVVKATVDEFGLVDVEVDFN
jgi:hypothetical protein